MMSKINPKSLKEIFTKDIIDALPKNDQIKRGVGIAKRSENPEWHLANNRRRIEDPDYDKKVGAKISETYLTPEGRKIQASKSKPHTEEAIIKIKNARQYQVFDQNAKDKMSLKKKGNNNRVRPIVTPLGIFPSRKEAAQAYLDSGKLNALKWIEKWLKTDTAHFYYITKEEYVLLTGKDI